MENALKKLTPWIPLAIAAGYFLFLTATWYQFIQSRKQTMAIFDTAVEEWLRTKPRPEVNDSTSRHDELNGD